MLSSSYKVNWPHQCHVPAIVHSDVGQGVHIYGQCIVHNQPLHGQLLPSMFLYMANMLCNISQSINSYQLRCSNLWLYILICGLWKRLANSHVKAICGRPGHINFIKNQCWPCCEHILANTHSCCRASHYLQLSLTGYSTNPYWPLWKSLLADTPTMVFKYYKVYWPHQFHALAIA